MATAALETLKAVRARLAGDVELSGMIAGIYEEVPPGVAMPYILIGETDEEPWDTIGGYGATVDIPLEIWSDYAGSREALLIFARVEALLHDQDFGLTGFDLVSCRRETMTVLKQLVDDKPVRRLVSRFQARVEAT